jgi:hypothetical protein
MSAASFIRFPPFRVIFFSALGIHLPREILSGGPVITADPFCRVKISLTPHKIYFLHAQYGPLLDLYFRAPILYRRRIFSVLFIAASFCAICLFYRVPSFAA